ncbi:hypothetical protein OH768_37100 [Streptomyces sp. NBC_01622]|uniref:hypothetical protein n=1 Tax=Streptomyces sp. NBC_01622 TaxID=2975903 RepID=UPI00386E2E4D|nr:hypothetical protein OH768_37100 [Streptomyces sp. NBC_01622]
MSSCGRVEALAARYPVRTGLIAAVGFGGVAGLAKSAVTWGVVLWGVGMGVVFGLASLGVRWELARRRPDGSWGRTPVAPSAGQRRATATGVALCLVAWGAGTVFLWLAGHLRPAPVDWPASAVIAVVPVAIGVLSGLRRTRASRLPPSED